MDQNGLTMPYKHWHRTLITVTSSFFNQAINFCVNYMLKGTTGQK